MHGSKNAALPLLTAALLTDEPLLVDDVPDLSDVRNLLRLLESLGCRCSRRAGEDDRAGRLELQVVDETADRADYEIVRTMRATFNVLGPLLARRGRAVISRPGGCNIGDRPVDLHLHGFRALGAEIHSGEGYIHAQAPASGRLQGARIFLGGPFGPTVTGTANVMSAATLAEGRTVIDSAACEPEIVDLANLLNAMGARISGAGTPSVTIDGVEALGGARHTVIPDRIEAGTLMIAAAITNGDVILENCPLEELTAFLTCLDAVGVQWELVDEAGDKADASSDSPDSRSQCVRVASQRRLSPAAITTQPHPGFPTDLQAQMMALLAVADGNSVITEKIFPDRFLHVAEMLRMGANLVRNGPAVLISGVRHLIGAPVMASDLRASAGLVLAGLGATGTTTVNRVYHIDRGYEKMERTLAELGAEIERVEGD